MPHVTPGARVRAAVLHAYDEPITIEEVRPPTLGDHSVRVRVEASGVCHSDLNVIHGAVPIITAPIILGHEGAGTVLEVGRQVVGVRPGDRVIGAYRAACGRCWYCLHDRSNLCQATAGAPPVIGGILGDGTEVPAFTGLGTFADEMTIRDSQAVRIDTDLPSEQLALIGCGVTTGVGAVLNTAQVVPGSTVAVIGCGGVGQAVVQGARVAGAARIFAVDPVELRRKAAETNGATDLIDPAGGDAVQQVKDATKGRGVDYAFEVIGNPATMLQAYESARLGGTVVIVGQPRLDATFSMPAFKIFHEEKRLLGSFYGTSQVRRDFQRYVDLIAAGRLDVDSMITRRISLEDVNDAFRAMEAGEVIRSVIV